MKYSKETTAEICQYIEAGNSNKDAAALVGITETTFYEWVKKPEFSKSIKKAELRCKARNIAIIQKAASTTWQAAAWWLERKYANEYARIEKSLTADITEAENDEKASRIFRRLVDARAKEKDCN